MSNLTREQGEKNYKKKHMNHKSGNIIVNLLLATTSSIRKTTPQKEKLYFVKLAILEAKIQDFLFRKAKTSSHNSIFKIEK